MFLLDKKFIRKNISPYEELKQFRLDLELQYSQIQCQFGNNDGLTPQKLENYSQKYIYSKLYKNPNMRRPSLQITQIPADGTPDEFRRSIHQPRSSSVVNQKIKGKNYFLALGQLPSSNRSAVYSKKRTPLYYTSHNWEKEEQENPYKRPQTSNQVIQECNKLIEPKVKVKKSQEEEREKPYKLIYTAKRTYNHQKLKKQHINNLKFIECLDKNISTLSRFLEM